MRLLLQVALLAVALSAAGAFAQQSGSNYTQGYANATISRASSYVESVNESGYLIFYPNLTQAYVYLNKAQAAYIRSPDQAVAYANEAQASAAQQYSDIGEYRYAAFAAMAAITVISAAVVAASMRKVRGRDRAKGGRG